MALHKSASNSLMKNFRLSRYLYLIGLLVFVSSCMSTKKLTYLQNNPDGVISDQEALVKSMHLKDVQYRLKPDDRLLVNIFSLTEEKLNFIKKPEMELRVDAAGQIHLPVMGGIAVAGLTVDGAAEKVKKTAAEYLRSPEVSMKLLNFNITVLGEVYKQGAFNMAESKVNILEALGYAGGVTDNANMQTIRIIRNENDTAKIYRVNLLEDNLLSSNKYFLQPNDVVIVNPLKAKSSNQQRIALVGLVISIVSSLAWILK